MNTAKPGAKPPNILIIMADQLAPQATATYGHPLVKTPAMNALAARGCTFTAAYTNSPLCAPARFSFMCGRHITRIAAYDNAAEFPAAIPTFAHYLRMMAYHTTLSGKMHFVGPDQLHGFNERLTTDIYPSDFAWTPDWELPDERIDKWYHNMDSVREAGVAATTFQLEYDEETGFFARRKLFDYAKAGNRQPFCMVVSFIHPHDPYVALQQWWDLYAPAQIDLPKVNIPLAQQDGFSRRIMAGITADAVKVSDDEVRNARHAYYANVSYFDHWVGRLVHTLEEAHLAEDTVVIVTSDHGDMLGERGLWYKMNFFEWSARVPLIIAGPGIHHGTISKACSLVDLLPTMLDIAASTGTTAPPLGGPLDGRNLMPLVHAHAPHGAKGGTEGGAKGHGDTAGDANEAISEYCAEMTAHPVFMIRRGRYKYIHCDADRPMLFDLETDPDELHNLAAHPQQPAHAELSARFAEEAARRWDSNKIRADVLRTQKQRRALHAAMTRGDITKWDYNPVRDASQEYVRNHQDWTEAAARTRFPPLPTRK